MLTRFISDQSYETFNVEYQNDSDVRIKGISIGVDGNLEYTQSPILSSIKDLRINNYVLNIISKNDKLSNFIELDQLEYDDIKTCLFSTTYDGEVQNESTFWRYDDGKINVISTYEFLNADNFFEIEYLDENTCKIFHIKNKNKYVLSYSISLSSVEFIPLSSQNLEYYRTELKYCFSENDNVILYSENESGKFYLEVDGNDIIIKKRNIITENNIFATIRKKNLTKMEMRNNWISYSNSFNKNNLNINENKSHIDVKNNFLFSTTINSIVSSLPINILTLKNQLNQENDQSRGNVFLNENETNLKEYESIFSGGYRELGYDKINLGFTSYSTPFVFKSGKTTYFHVPHDIYPYKILNINSSKLIESGAIGGNSPLNSDKIWKKLKDYRDTTPYSYPQEENTGQWLCTWLSAGNIDTRPIWVDRFYNPSKTTPYVALSSTNNEVRYKDSFSCLDIGENIQDVRSSLTFEKGCYYAYMHLGKNDYLNLINTLSSDNIHKKIDVFRSNNFENIEKYDNSYFFDGKSIGYSLNNSDYKDNIASFSFFISKDDWNIPTGNMIFGNYIDRGFGFYNHISNTQYKIFKNGNSTIKILNNKFEEIDTISAENLSTSDIAGVVRREGFENIHIITKDFKLQEIKLKGNVIDSNNSIRDLLNLTNSDEIYQITNDLNNCYVNTNKGLISVDLSSNLVYNKTIYKTITTPYTTSSSIIADNNQNIYEIYGLNPIFRKEYIYSKDDSNNFFIYNTDKSLLSSIELDDNISCYTVDENDEINALTDDNYISIIELVDGKEKFKIKEKIKIHLLDDYGLTAKNISICEKFEYGNLIRYKEIFSENITTNEKYIIQIDAKKNQNILKINDDYDTLDSNFDFNNYKFNKYYVDSRYGINNYIFKIKFLNLINDEDYTVLDFIIKKEDLATGFRHFVFTIDPFNGCADAYLDGELYESKKFEKRKYILSNTFEGKIQYASNPYYNGMNAFDYFNDISDFTYSGIQIKHINIFNRYLNRFEVLYFYNIENPSDDIIFNIPSGSRSFIDKIDKFFNFNPPMFKTNYFNLKFLNTGIYDDKIKEEIEEEIKEKIQEYLPFYVKINKSDWINTNSKKITLDGDYNVSNTLTNI